MLESLKPFTTFLTTAVVGVILLLFRPQVARLVDWVITFRRISKTKDGYALESAVRPDLPADSLEKREQAIAAVEAIELVPLTPETSVTPAPDNWINALVERRFDDAIALLQHDANTAADADRRLIAASAIGYVKFRQDPATAVAYFERLVDEHPKKLQPYSWYALTLLWTELPEKALVIVDRALTAVGQNASLLDTKSDCLARLGREDEAIAAAMCGITADPQFVANYLNVAQIYEKKGELDLARNWYEKAADASYGAPHVLEIQARFIASHGEPAEAIRCYQRLAERQPENPIYLALLGNAYLDAGLNSLALEAYLRANDLASGTASWILANIGNIYNNRGFYGEACKYLKRALEQDPYSQYAHERFAQAQKLEAEERGKLPVLLSEARAAKRITASAESAG